MKRLGVTLLTAAAVAVYAVGTASAKDRQRSNPGTTTGTAAPRGGGESSSGSSGGGSSSGSGTSSSPSGSSRGGSFDSPSTSRAVPRGGESGRVSSRSGNSDDVGSARAVPTYSRPRDGRTPAGTAVDRTSAPFTSLPIYVRYGYYPFGFGYPGYGSFGLGFNYYDPFWWDYAGYGYGYGSYYGGGYYGGGYGARAYRDTGALRLKVKPRDAQVFVDGYYVGLVNDYDGIFQRLTLESGGHRVELRGEGFQPLSFEVLIVPGETITYRGDLKRIP